MRIRKINSDLLVLLLLYFKFENLTLSFVKSTVGLREKLIFGYSKLVDVTSITICRIFINYSFKRTCLHMLSYFS